MPLMACMPLVKAESAPPSMRRRRAAPARGSAGNWSEVVAVGDRPLITYWPSASVVTVPSSTLLRSTSTVQPCSGVSPLSATLSKLASCHTRPFKVATPAMPPTAIEALAEAVCVGVFHLTCAVLVMSVPAARPGTICTLKRSCALAPGARVPYVAA